MAANDKPNPFSNPNPFEFTNSYTLTTNILLTITVLLFSLILLLVSFYFYSHWYLCRAHQRRHRSYLIFYVDSFISVATPPIGLNPSVIHSLPIFIYSAHSDLVECAICLFNFEENEMGRVLPRYNHYFQVEYIDMWFQSHSTCPLCRSLVERVQPRDQPRPEVAINMCELGSSSEGDQAGEEENTFKKEAEGSTASFRSPGGRMLSFKRTLNIERKSRPSSPLSENCAFGCAPSMTEMKTS